MTQFHKRKSHLDNSIQTLRKNATYCNVLAQEKTIAIPICFSLRMIVFRHIDVRLYTYSIKFFEEPTLPSNVCDNHLIPQSCGGTPLIKDVQGIM